MPFLVNALLSVQDETMDRSNSTDAHSSAFCSLSSLAHAPDGRVFLMRVCGRRDEELRSRLYGAPELAPESDWRDRGASSWR